jgi:hypothetical protein
MKKKSNSIKNIFTTYWGLDFVEIFHNIHSWAKLKIVLFSEKTGKKIVLLYDPFKYLFKIEKMMPLYFLSEISKYFILAKIFFLKF